MSKFDHDQTNNHRVKNKSFGVEECWSNINGVCLSIFGWVDQTLGYIMSHDNLLKLHQTHWYSLQITGQTKKASI